VDVVRSRTEAVRDRGASRLASRGDALRQSGRLARDRDGRYRLGRAEAGVIGVVGEFYPDPNEGT
jgi:hypothetical protein